MFSADQLIIQNGNYIFQSLNHVIINLKPRFLIKSGYYNVPSPSTALDLTNDFHQKCLSLLTETKTRIAKTLFQTTAEEVADAETTRL